MNNRLILLSQFFKERILNKYIIILLVVECINFVYSIFGCYDGKFIDLIFFHYSDHLSDSELIKN